MYERGVTSCSINIYRIGVKEKKSTTEYTEEKKKEHHQNDDPPLQLHPLHIWNIYCTGHTLCGASVRVSRLRSGMNAYAENPSGLLSRFIDELFVLCSNNISESLYIIPSPPSPSWNISIGYNI